MPLLTPKKGASVMHTGGYSVQKILDLTDLLGEKCVDNKMIF